MARINYPAMEALSEETQAALQRIRPINVFSLMAWAETLAPPAFDFVIAIFSKMNLEPRLRQLAILRVGYLCESKYELFHHEKLARKVGITDEEIACTARGGAALEKLGERERVVVQFAGEMTINIRVSDATFALARGLFPQRELTELALVTSFYSCICRFLETMDVEIEKPKA